MKQVWEMVRHNYDENHILNKLVHKDEWCKTTSRKFKEDILRIFNQSKNMVCLELGSCRGDTTRVFAECFKEVHSFERADENIEYIKKKCSDVQNVNYNSSDVYSSDFEIPHADVAFVDAGHTTELVQFDIKRLLESNENMILIFDDYGHEGRTVRDAINKKLSDGDLNLIKYIGEDKGYIAANNKVFIGREGLICNV